ncbi:MAG: hypothetical protein KKD74_07130 [Bacteroidetes bacterium]|nr:hypothetical protein [Bacteroidota bacterium]
MYLPESGLAADHPVVDQCSAEGSVELVSGTTDIAEIFATNTNIYLYGLWKNAWKNELDYLFSQAQFAQCPHVLEAGKHSSGLK